MPTTPPLPGRRPDWPPAWLALAVKLGGYPNLRAALGIRSKTTLSNKIAGRSPWMASDVLVLESLAERESIDIDSLLSPRTQRVAKASGSAVGAAPLEP